MRPSAMNDAVESPAIARVLFWKSIICRQLIWHETQAHRRIDSGRNCHAFSQRFSFSPIGITSHEIDLERWLHEL